jgi:hydroxysqualene dehydroxylase
VTASAGPRVAVVGGGLAGISAALACAASGATVTLFEKRSRLGGLTWSFSHDGLTMDNGQHVFLRCCTAYIDFLKQIGSWDDVELQERLDVTVLSESYRDRTDGGPRNTGARAGARLAGTSEELERIAEPVAARAVLRRDRLPAPLHLGRSLLRYGFVPLGVRARFAGAALALARMDLDDPALDQQTFASWLSQHGQSHAAISSLWDLICLPTVNLPAGQASLAMAAKVFQTGLLTDASGGDIGWSRVPLGLLHGERAAAALRRAGVDVRLGEPVLAVEPASPNQDRPSQDRPSQDRPRQDSHSTGPAGRGFSVRAANGSIAADGVVVALPHYCTEDVLPPGTLPGQCRPSRLASSPIVNVHVRFDRHVTRLPFFAGLGADAQWVFDRTASSGLGGPGQYLAVSISAADDYIGTRPEQLEAQVVASLRQLLPAAREARVVGTLVTREHQATFRAVPGSAADRAPTRTHIPGLVLAGAWTATGWPPTMEGAVRSGLNAARAVLVATGQRSALPPIPGARASTVSRPGRRARPKAEMVSNGRPEESSSAPGPQVEPPLPGLGAESEGSHLYEPVRLEEVV